MIPSHPNQRFFIGGFSPNVHNLNPEVLESGIVIGINQFPQLGTKLDYWLACDTDACMRLFPDLVHSVKVPKFMQKYEHVPDAPADYWFKRTRELPTQWQGELCWNATSACAATHLACLMGASEVVLYGVDMTPDGRADGSDYKNPSWWTPHAKGVSDWFTECSRVFNIPIYKTNSNSPLNLPLSNIPLL